MILNIITPCSRPENLKTIEESINIPREYFKWFIVFDNDEIPDCYIPPIAQAYCYKQKGSIVGHAQRNFALDLIDHGYIYFNDDDTVIHSMLWDRIEKNVINNTHDFISFDQKEKSGKHRLFGNNIKVDHIDSHNFIVHSQLCQNVRFDISKYNADGYFATECFRLSKSPLYIPEYLSIYNALR
jgi:hypothetical protein